MKRRLLAVREAVIAALNRRDTDGILAPVADDVIVRDIALDMPLIGLAAVRAAVKQYMDAFPDFRLEITSTTVDGLRIAQEWTLTGTHLGEYMGIPPTGRWTQTYGVTVTTFDEDDVVIEASMYWNPLAMLRQLGVETPWAATAV